VSVSLIIPAYNEEKTIGRIIAVARQIEEVEEIIVVDDGSSDCTAANALAAGAVVKKLPQNMGKAFAMVNGAVAAGSDHLLFLDADLLGLECRHIANLINPVLQEQVRMSFGVFSKGRGSTDIAQTLWPTLSGQRCLARRDFLELASACDGCGFGIEIVLTKYAKKEKWPVEWVDLPGVTHVTKEEKRGSAKGAMARVKMYWEIAKMLAIPLDEYANYNRKRAEKQFSHK